MTISYQTGIPADASSFAHCHVEAFLEDKLYHTLCNLTPTSPPQRYLENVNYRTKRFQIQLAHPHTYWIKAIDDSTSKIVGISGWEEPKVRWLNAPDKVVEDLERPLSWNKEVIELYDKKFEEVNKTALGDTNDFWSMCTSTNASARLLHLIATHRL